MIPNRQYPLPTPPISSDPLPPLSPPDIHSAFDSFFYTGEPTGIDGTPRELKRVQTLALFDQQNCARLAESRRTLTCFNFSGIEEIFHLFALVGKLQT